MTNGAKLQQSYVSSSLEYTAPKARGDTAAAGAQDAVARSWIAGLNASKAKLGEAYGPPTPPCEGSECARRLVSLAGLIIKPVALAEGAYASYESGSLLPLGLALLGGKLAAMETVRIRHYTSNKGVAGIEESGVLKASDQNTVFAELARGKPLAARDAEAAYGLKQGRGRNYVETNAPANQVNRVYNPLTRSYELQIKGDLPLDMATFHRR